MKLRETFRSSFKTLARNKLRSLLTMLGVIIGIFSVTMLTSIGEGVKLQVIDQVESLGSNLLYVLPGKVQIGLTKKPGKLGVQSDGGIARSSLMYDDVLSLKDQGAISAVSGIFNTVAKLDDLNINAAVTGVDEDFADIRNLQIQHGSFINRWERVNAARVAVLGHQANKEIFKTTGSSVGEHFHMNGFNYTVVGILKYQEPENYGPTGEDLNIKIYIPITEVLSRVKDKSLPQIIVKASSARAVSKAEKTVREILRERHREDDFSILKQKDILNVIFNIISIITAGLGGIAAISLIVGGIGIMNIMLVSVAERTREIGIRKAIGAKNRDILIQFLIEAMVLSVIGGILGLLVGFGGARLLPELSPTIKTAVSMPAVLISLAFALLVGIFFGVYPATKAAKMDPIESLRSE